MADRYEVESELGHGGMATVYLAKDLKHARSVAIKVLRPELAEVLGHERFLREIQISANLVHPHILPLHDSGEADGLLYYVMPYIPGESLHARLDREKQLPLEEALKIGTQILSALSHAHSHGIIHRDIKPANVLLSAGEAVVADFGIARAIGAAGEGRITQTGMSLGTPGYMSPEQAGGSDDLDARSDVYAVACLIYEMLAGEPPFTGPIENVIQQHLTADPPSAAVRRRTVTPELDAVIRKALEKSPADRFATASQFSDAIVAATAKAPIIIEQVTRPGRRFRAGLVAGGVIAVAAIAGSAVMLSSPGAVPFEERDWLLITSFENLTGDSVFDRSLDAALASSISQSRRVNVFPQGRVAEALVRMQQADAARLDQPTGIEIAVREGLKAVLVPSISQVADQYAMSARIVDPTNGVDLAAASVTVESRDAILTSVDKLGRAIRRRLGESRLDLIQAGGWLARATTPSLEALKAFTDAGIAWESGQEEQARALWEEALRHDSTFAWAHASMGLMYYWYNDRPKGEEHFEQALAGLDRLPRREQLWVRSLIEGSRGDREEASNILEVYLRDYPDDRDAWYNFGSGLMRMGRCDEGIPALERALELDSTMVNAYINTATCHSNSERPTEAISAYRKAFALDSDAVTGGFINHEYGSVLVEVGEFEEAQRTFEMMLEGQPDQQARGLRSIALLRMFQGRYDEAIDQMRQAVRITRTSEFGLSEFRNRLYLAAAYRTKADTAAHRRELDAASAIREGGLYIEPFFLTLQGKMYARMGELDRADEIVQAIADVMGETDGDRAAYDLARGELALARGNHAEAIELLEDAKLRRDDRYFTESLAHAYAVSGATDDAIREYEEVVDGIGFGSESQEPWILAHYELGQLYEAKGEYAKAIASYQRFVEIWANADPDIAAAVDEVRRRIETLRRIQEVG